jgi:sterol desaturase/sphingolipid hydroxylase (fatty acid hydroxylase superfamily)
MSKLFVSTKNESPRIFKNNLFELLSKTPWFVPIVFFLPIVVYLFLISELYLTHSFLLFFFGLIFWTFTEYTLHRFVFHYEPKSEWGKKLHWTFHGVHHDFPMDSYRLVMPPFISLLLGGLFYLAFLSILGKVLSPSFGSGFFFGYLIYDIGHYAIHHFAFKSRFFLKIKQHHMKHHFQEPNKGFGVSTPLWDFIFKTIFKK